MFSCAIQELKREFVTELIYPALQANCIYEVGFICLLVCGIRSNRLLQNVYLLGTSLARPVIARGMIEVAERENCE